MYNLFISKFKIKGFAQPHGTSGDHHATHTSGHNVPSHSFPGASPAGAEPYPAAPPSQTDYQPSVIPSVIPPTITSNPTSFGGIAGSGASVTGYPAAGTPSPINTPLTGDQQPSREYLPARRT